MGSNAAGEAFMSAAARVAQPGQGTIRAEGRCTQFPGKHQSNSTHIMSALEAVLQLAKIAGYWAVRNTPNSSKEFHTPS